MGYDDISVSDSGFVVDDSYSVEKHFTIIQRLSPPDDDGKRQFVVYKARIGTRIVVIKTIAEEYRDSQFHINLLHKEYEIGLRMASNRFPTVLNLTTLPKVGLSLVSEYVEGTTLKQYLAESSRLGFKTAMTILQQICAAIDYIHSIGIAHRDIKPSNIIINRHTLGVTLIDFGLSHCQSYAVGAGHAGTPGYIAPEIAESRNDMPDLYACDIYSIGRLMMKMNVTSRAWHKTAAKCCDSNPQNRPDSGASIIRGLNRLRKRQLYAKLAGFVAIVTAAIVIFLSWNHTSSNSPESEPTRDAENDTIRQSAIIRDRIDTSNQQLPVTSNAIIEVSPQHDDAMAREETPLSSHDVAPDVKTASDSLSPVQAQNTYQPVVHVTYLPDGRVRTDSLMEDGSWKIDIVDVKAIEMRKATEEWSRNFWK